MPEACNFIKKEALAQVFSCEYCEIFRNTFFIEHLWVTACKLNQRTSLIHQINEDQEVGHDESEIVNSVIRAMKPSLALRNVLETTYRTSFSPATSSIFAVPF